jgi:hypothetical protein
MMTTYRVSAQDILSCAVEIIEEHGWARGEYRNEYRKWTLGRRCIRAALRDAWMYLCDNDPRADATALTEAINRVSGAIYKPGTIGGIMDWEYRLSTDTAAVLDVLRRAASDG